MITTVGKWRHYFLLAAIFCALPGDSQAAEPPVPPLVLERTIPLTGVSGRIDHMAVDLGRKHLFVAELGNNTVDVLDLATGQVIHRIGGLKEPQGIGYAPIADMIAVANAEDGTVRLFRADDFSAAGSIGLGDDADNVRLDARSGWFVVGYGGGGLVVLDPARRSVVSHTELAAHPEGFRSIPSHRASSSICPTPARSPPWICRPASKLHIPDLRANFPMTLDEPGAILATVFRTPPRLLLLETSQGMVKDNLATCGDADDVFFDARRRRIYVSCGEGWWMCFSGMGATAAGDK